MPGMYFEDFEVGDSFTTPRRTVTEADVASFAGLSGDYNPLHTDRVFASETPFGEPIAHGMLILAMITGLNARLGINDGTAIAMLGIDEWRFHRPVYFGDTIYARVTITGKRPTSKPGRGILNRKFEVFNQRHELAQDGFINLMCRRRPEMETQP
ncbi:MAG: dehydratase [Dehalococcoidia bacterium]|nr:dehydratase [Dehalococcoidia bacterium]